MKRILALLPGLVLLAQLWAQPVLAADLGNSYRTMESQDTYGDFSSVNQLSASLHYSHFPTKSKKNIYNLLNQPRIKRGL